MTLVNKKLSSNNQLSLDQVNKQKVKIQKVMMKSLNFLSQTENEELKKRLYEMGLYPGLEIEVIGQISFGGVYIIQFDQTRLALNTQEVACLLGH